MSVTNETITLRIIKLILQDRYKNKMFSKSLTINESYTSNKQDIFPLLKMIILLEKCVSIGS